MSEKQPISDNKNQSEIFRAPAWLRWLMGFVVVMILIMNGLLVAVYFEEGWGASVQIFGVIMLLMTGLGSFIVWTTFSTVSLSEEALTIHRPIGRLTIPNSEITGVDHRDRLLVHTADRTYRFYFPMRSVQSDIMAALRRQVPAVRDAHQTWMAQDLPLVINRQRSAIWTNLFYFVVMGLGFIALGGGIIWFAITEELPKGWTDAGLPFFMGLLILGVGGLMTYMFLFDFVWRYSFGREEISLRYATGRARYPVSGLQQMEIKHEIRRYRGIERDAYFLQFDFEDGRSVRLEPTENGVPSGFDPADDQRFLTDLLTLLQRHYLSKEDAPAASHPVEQAADPWGKADVQQTISSPLYDLTVEVLNYGEQSMGAERIHFLFNRPLNGIDRLQTVNGQGAISPNGRFLAIFDLLVLTVFDLATERVYRLRDRTEWVYHAVRFDDQYLFVDLRDGRTFKRTAALQPIPLDSLPEIMIPQDKTRTSYTLPQEQLRALLNHARYLPDDQLATHFETLRDIINGFGLDVLPDVLHEAVQPRSRSLQELLIYVLVDQNYPPAFPYFVEWLDHPNEEIRFSAAMALDKLADSRFAIEKMIDKGWVQHDQIAAAIPDIKQWWRNEGQSKAPTETAWRSAREASRPATEREKQYNFVELNPQWVMQGDGIIQHPVDNYRLPHARGIHVVGGTARLKGEESERFAVFEIDSHDEQVIGVFVRLDGAWRDVLGRTSQTQLNHTF